MHVLVPGASMDSSAGLRDSDIHAIRCPDVCDYLRDSGYFIRDSLVVPLAVPPIPHQGAVNRPLQSLLHFSIPCLSGSLPGILDSVRSSYSCAFLVFCSLHKIETERRREGK